MKMHEIAYIRMKDKSSSHFIAGQNISVVSNIPTKVVASPYVINLVKNGIAEECKKREWEVYQAEKAERDVSNKEAKKKNAKFNKDAQEMLESANKKNEALEGKNAELVAQNKELAESAKDNKEAAIAANAAQEAAEKSLANAEEAAEKAAEEAEDADEATKTEDPPATDAAKDEKPEDESKDDDSTEGTEDPPGDSNETTPEVAEELLNQAVDAGVITVAGNWYKMGEEKIGQGKGKVVEAIAEDDELYESIVKAVAATK